jgi:hypothetical protein
MAISLILSSSFAFLQSLVQSTLADPPQRVSSSPGLWFPSAHSGVEGPLVVGLPDPLRFRLQGLVTLLTACSLRSLADLFSDRQRSWDLPFGVIPSTGVLAVTGEDGPPALSSCRCCRRSGRPGPAGRGFWALPSAEVPCSEHGFSAQASGGSHGFCPFQGHGKGLDQDFARSPLARFSWPPLK